VDRAPDEKRDSLAALRRDAEALPGPSGAPWRWLLIVVAAVLFAALACGAWWLLQPRAVLVKAVDVMAEGGAAGSVLTASGYVVAQQQAAIAAQTTGMIVEVTVREGERVEKDQLIARLDDRAAQSAANAAAGQLQAGEAAVVQYKALAERTAKDLKRKQVLAAEGAISQAALEQAIADAKQAQAQVAYYTGLVVQYRNNLEYYRTQLAYMEIRAPFAGVVTERYAHPGEMISPQAVGGYTQTGICTIVDMASLEVDVDVNEAFIARLSAGQAAVVTLDAYPGLKLSAHIITIVPTANQQKATVKVRVGFDHLDPHVLPQMSAQVAFEAGKTADMSVASLLVPREAVQGAGDRAYVWRLESGLAKRVAVKASPAPGGRMRILSGLSEGDRVILSSDSPLASGTKVRES
jgi:HlyD family secretion protein